MTRRLLSLLLLLTLFSLPTFSQSSLYEDVPELSFAHLDRNHLIYPGDSLSMEHFFNKLDTILFTGKGQVSIMHIGGSHVQAGVFSQTMRDHLINLAPGLASGRGLVFPFMKTNTPASYCIDRTGEWNYCRNAVAYDTRLGLAGASVTTSDTTASFSIVTRAKNPKPTTPSYDFNTVFILGYGSHDSIQPIIHFQDSLFYGDYDEEQECYKFSLPDYTDSLYVDFGGVPGTFTVTGVYLDNQTPGITYHGIGINGARVESYLSCENLERDLRLVNPDLVIFGIGINDAAASGFTAEQFQRDYEMLIDIILDVNPNCALLFVTNNDSYKKIKKNKYQNNPNGAIAEKVFLQLGKEYNAAVWDFFDIMGGLTSMQQWQNAGLAQKDKIHFTNSGYALIGDLLYNALMERYTEHLRQTATR